jgi:predicted PurR-regulated permease PerM
MSARQTAINTAVILLVVLVAWLLIQVRSTLVLLIIGILFAAAIEPLVNRLRRRGLKRGQAILLIYAGLLTAVFLALLLAVPEIVRQTTSLIDNIPDILQSARERAAEIKSTAIRNAALRGINEVNDFYIDTRTNPDAGLASNAAIVLLTTVGGALASIVTVLVVAFYWLTEKSTIKQVVLRKVSAGQRDRAFTIWEEIERRIGGWARGQMTLCLVIGVISTAGYLALGLKYWVALGLWAGFTELIPFIGPILGGAAAFVVALTDSWQKALIVVAFVVVLQQLESAVLVPRVMRSSVGMSPLTVILAVLVGTTLNGPLGAILAIPIGAAVQAIIQELVRDQVDQAGLEGTASTAREPDAAQSVPT